MSGLSKDVILDVAKNVVEYVDILNRPNADNNLVFKNGQLQLVKKGKVELSRDITTSNIMVNDIEYGINPFVSNDTVFSVFEADRKDNTTQMIWVNTYNNIDFPKVVPIAPFTYLLTKQWPDIFDIGKIMISAFTTVVPEENLLDKSEYFYHEVCMHYSRLNVELTFTDGRTIKNLPLKFKNKFSQYHKNLPFNEFTVEQYLCRLFKSYGSCTRDIYHTIRCYELGINAQYNLLDDLHGIDGWIHGIPIYQFTNTEAAQEFATEKQNYRHRNLPQDKAIVLIKNNNNTNGIHVASDEALLSAINFAKDDNQKGIKKIIC